MKTFGTITRDNNQWVISAQANVAIRLKRVFPRVVAARVLQDTHRTRKSA